MYLPQCVPLARPHVAVWFGRSGKRYDFAVSRARPIWLGQPVVYVLVRYDGDDAVPLYIGRATAADPQLGGPGSEAVAAWEQAMALGMTHLHLRFEACSDEDRAAEVDDLVAAIRPALNEIHGEAGVESVRLAVPVAADTVADLPPGAALSPAASSPPRRHRWLARTASTLAARYRGWRLRPAAAPAAVPADRVTVRADAVVAGDPAALPAEPPPPPEQPLTLAIETPPAVVAHAAAEPVAGGGLEPEPRASATEVRQRLGFGGEDIVVLFAGEIGWAAGADLAVEAMATVHADAPPVRLLLVGEGPQRAELEGRAWHGGFAHACRFVGDLPAEAFAEIFAACDAVVIPARAAQGAVLAEHGLAAGKPVLTTHQAQLACVRHGENGLVTYDNPGSLVWGLREIRALVAQRRSPAALAA